MCIQIKIIYIIDFYTIQIIERFLKFPLPIHCKKVQLPVQDIAMAALSFVLVF